MGSKWVFFGFITFYWVVMGFNGFKVGFLWFHYVLPGYDGIKWVQSGFSLVALRFTGL